MPKSCSAPRTLQIRNHPWKGSPRWRPIVGRVLDGRPQWQVDERTLRSLSVVQPAPRSEKAPTQATRTWATVWFERKLVRNRMNLAERSALGNESDLRGP